MQTLLHTDSDAVQVALGRLDLEEEILLTAAQASYLAKANSTANHPPMHAPFVAWSEAVRALRDGLVTRGWQRNNDKNWPRTIHPSGNIALTVATGNEATGRAGDSPSTKAAKGPSTVGALEVNRGLQFWLPGMEPPRALDANEEEDSKTITWLLLVHHADNEIRAELSLPLDVDRDGKVAVWRERIILRSIQLDGEPVEVQPPALPDIDVAVRRKA
jgi:hypothetical protein